MKIYILMEHYGKTYSYPVIATKSKELAQTIMRYRKNPKANTSWIEEVEYDNRDLFELPF